MRNGVKNSRFQCIILTISSALWYYKIYNKDNYTLLRYMKRGIKMKRKILSALLLTMSVTALSCGYAFAAETTTSAEIKTAVEDTNKPPVDKNTVMGVVKSVSESSITIETMKGRPYGEKSDDSNKPETEEKTVLITSATLVYSKEDDTTNKTDLDSLKEGTMIRIELADGSSKDNSTVTAKTITVSERKEKPDGKIKDHKKLTDKDTTKTTA